MCHRQSPERGSEDSLHVERERKSNEQLSYGQRVSGAAERQVLLPSFGGLEGSDSQTLGTFNPIKGECIWMGRDRREGHSRRGSRVCKLSRKHLVF